MPTSAPAYDQQLVYEPASAVDMDGRSLYDGDMASGSESLRVGAELFGYRIEEVIGKGGMGTVYRASQLSLERQVALKVLHPQRIRNPAQVEGFLREARSAGKLNHPHLVLVHSAHADPAQGLYCYSMEYVPGTTLTQMVFDHGPLRRSAALHITYQIAKALGHAHRHGLVHRDVKPDNILVTRAGQAKLADLGLVRDRLDGVSSTSSKQLTLVGTPEYSAPEQSRNPQRAIAASDIYSLGACLYFMLVGKPPFGGETVIDLIVRTALEPVPYPKDLGEDCRQLLDHMLAKRVEDRFRNGETLCSALEALAQGQQVTAASTKTPLPFAAPAKEAVDTDVEQSPVDEPSSARFTRRRRRRR